MDGWMDRYMLKYVRTYGTYVLTYIHTYGYLCYIHTDMQIEKVFFQGLWHLDVA